MAEVVTPLTVPVANTIWSVQVQHQKVAVSFRKDFWLKAPKAIIHLKYYEADDQKASGVTIHRFDDHFNIIRRIDADSAVFRNGKWELVHGIEQIFEPKSEEVVVHSFDTRMVSLDLLPEDLAKVVPRADEMNFSQLYEYVKKIEAEGYDAIRYRVDMQGKFAFPFVCIIMALIGAGLAGRGKIKEGLPISISYGIGIAFLYWVAYSFCVSLGYADKLPPIVAVWVVNFIWLILAVYLLINAE
jgi:lipopolysaccharide export system permease protein